MDTTHDAAASENRFDSEKIRKQLVTTGLDPVVHAERERPKTYRARHDSSHKSKPIIDLGGS